ncbi:4-amino-4-deoxy-L-arabinose transferase [Amycolatopsis xylanica]|uniref:4-amino-4-deoxy-L-arabinose transferase n=1 Tax=Amycolatopsis xylanica TaxID=589385 RepID=A0A1H3S0I2_9PSEU|nr:glycosyltransferase family 39 protein [Amycolatopsis xylanica]SDZ31424.1 4-amino-4-deoxy-L-arabinose transferase [Amycolatopsis xylanica]
MGVTLERADTRLAVAPVFTIAGAMGVLLLVLSGRYGFFGDELYFLAAGRHLAWGYADQPPLLPLLARLLDTGSPVVLRLPATLAMAAGVVFAALIARELGGGRKAQILTAGAFAVCTQMLGTGHYLATSTIDPFLWTVILWLIVRWIRTRDDNLLLWLGVVTGLALNTKFLIGTFWTLAVVALLALGPRDLLKRPKLWAGAGIAAVMIAPTLIWQAANGWPQLEMGEAISAEVGSLWGGRLVFLPSALLLAGLPVGAVLLLYGLWRLLRSARWREYRFLGWTTVGLVLLFFAVNGRAYYVAGMLPLSWAVAAVELESGRASRWWRWIATWPVYVLSFLVMLPGALPIWPQSWLADPDLPRPVFSSAEIGWPEFTDSVAATYRTLPPGTAIVTRFYWYSAALDYYGRDRLPEPSSGSRGYWTLTSPPDTADTVLYVGEPQEALRQHFTEVRALGRTGGAQDEPMWLATGRKGPWSEVWPAFRNLGL